ncbi:MAG TPA: ABATE domain-containing protein [Gemmatimonadaceae bacterium]|nr:ABATE domain-containing protein [Gemmatimonadaceae bacterium]
MSTASLSLVHDHAGSSPESLVFIGERLWLDFVNSDDASRTRKGTRTDALDTFDGFIRWLCLARLLDEERAAAMTRRAQQQPTGASAALHEARRLRNVLRALAERGADSADRATQVAIAEINRVLGRSAGTRRVEPRSDGGFVRNFVTVGDVFAGLLIPVIESAADALVNGEMARVRRCADPRCARVFFDGSRNGKRRWCEMATCGNRAKAARHRRKLKLES